MLAATPTNTDVWVLVAVVVLLVLLSLLALAEMSLARISKQKAEALKVDGARRADMLVRLASEPTRWVNPLLLTVNILQTLQATLTGVVANRLFGAPGVVIGVVLNVVVFFIFAEAVPKTYAVLYAVRGATATAPLVSALVAFWPLRVASHLLIRITNLLVKGRDLNEGPFISETEFLGLVDAAAKDSVIEAEEQVMINSIITFGDKVAREVMRPRHEIITVDETDTVADALIVAIEHQFSRMPVIRVDDDEIDDVAGTVNTKDLIRLQREGQSAAIVQSVMKPAHVVPEGKYLKELMREMQRSRNHLTIVADEFGAFTGIVTLEDCLEELVGEIGDEHDDADNRFRRQTNGDILIDGTVAVDDVSRHLQVSLSSNEYDTLGGYVFGALGRVPRVNDAVTVSGLRFCVEEIDGRRITIVRHVATAVAPPTTH